MARIDSLREMLAQDPANSRIHFMLGMEHLSGGNREEARRELEALLVSDPAYVAAYYQAGRVCEELGDVEAARRHYEAGIRAAVKAGDRHAQSELQAALDLLG